jgi:hypothetical protein
MSYPFEEGQHYFTIEDDAIVESVWDYISEDLHHPGKQYFASLDEAEQSFPTIKIKHLL